MKHRNPALRTTDTKARKARPNTVTLTRTKGLLAAALRVWELKNGYR